jgi:hypothetical protein
MPTYRNTGAAGTLVISAGARSYSFPPGVDVAIEAVITDSRLTLVDAAPYYNPLVANAAVTFAAAGTETVTVDLATRQVCIWQVSGCNITVYLQAAANTPALATLRPGDSLSIPCNEQFSSLVLVADGPGSCTVAQGKSGIELEG